MPAGHDVEKRFALFRRGALVDDRLQLAVALMQCPGEMNGPRENQTIEFGLLEMSLGDPHADHALAITLRRQGIEVARAAKCAIAIVAAVASPAWGMPGLAQAFAYRRRGSPETPAAPMTSLPALL